MHHFENKNVVQGRRRAKARINKQQNKHQTTSNAQQTTNNEQQTKINK